jgi:hypothetical protein
MKRYKDFENDVCNIFTEIGITLVVTRNSIEHNLTKERDDNRYKLL